MAASSQHQFDCRMLTCSRELPLLHSGLHSDTQDQSRQHQGFLQIRHCWSCTRQVEGSSLGLRPRISSRCFQRPSQGPQTKIDARKQYIDSVEKARREREEKAASERATMKLALRSRNILTRSTEKPQIWKTPRSSWKTAWTPLQHSQYRLFCFTQCTRNRILSRRSLRRRS